ncbi:Wobble nucleotide-excising tRNase [Nitrosovibrio sp. Nv6]|nr:Wobble nucleotide-excising tRNase [Nitrosovibrio sp. Nv6]
MLHGFIYIQNIGRFEKAHPMQDAGFGSCTLIFGENGWGKSTVADILRSLTTNNPSIILGRKTLAGGPDQKAVLSIDTQQTVFRDGAWTGIKPRIAIYDSFFINENVFSGDIVSADHLKNQYGLVLGEEGVGRLKRIVALDDENRELNSVLRIAESELNIIIKTIAPPAMRLGDFLALGNRDDIDSVIASKDAQAQRVRRSKELKAAAEPQLLPIPTETQKFRELLNLEIDQISESALAAVRVHIAEHECTAPKSDTSLEGWLEAGTGFVNSGKCPFCGQFFTAHMLVDAYKDFFSDAYKSLSVTIKKTRETFAKYQNGDFRKVIEGLLEQNDKNFTYWREAGKLEPPDLGDARGVILLMEEAAVLLDVLFQDKQAHLTEAIDGKEAEASLSTWEKGRNVVGHINRLLNVYASRIKTLKDSIDPSDLPRLETELKVIQATKRRHELDVIALISRIDAIKARKEAIAKEKAATRKELDDYGRSITGKLGTSINAYLLRLNAGFKIDYKEPDYRGKEPAASYQILINNVPVPPRSPSETLDKPSFRNTLSTGDKSTLALALFLAKINADPALKDTIVVLDDAFTSLDNFRRQFTANEIRKLCGLAAQTIVLSHDKNFLRLLWEKVDQSSIKSIALQTGAPGITTLAPFDIKTATQARHVTERGEIEEFLEGEPHSPNYIRTRLRTVCEDFYRKGDPSLFHEAASLEEITRILNKAPTEHPYRGALDDLREINEYSRVDNHAAVEGNPFEETTGDELKGFCRKVISLTRGM